MKSFGKILHRRLRIASFAHKGANFVQGKASIMMMWHHLLPDNERVLKCLKGLVCFTLLIVNGAKVEVKSSTS